MRYRGSPTQDSGEKRSKPRHAAGPAAALVLCLVLAPSGLAADPDFDPAEERTIRDLRTVVLSIEAYQLDHNGVPGPTDGLVSADFLRPFLEPPYVRQGMFLPVTDGWGGALGYWSDGSRFVVVTNGPDGVPDRTYAGVTAAELEDGGDDIAVVNGVLAAVPLHLREMVRGGQQKATMADMRSLGTCIEAFKIDNGGCPGPTPGQVDVAWMRDHVEPIYIRNLPLTDAWGNPFIYWCDGERYRVASLGLDQIQDGPFEEIPAGTGTQKFDADIVFEDGEFKRFPQGAQY